MKRALLILGVASSFLLGFGVSAQAWPIHGRNSTQGYFLGNSDSSGWEVLPSGGPSGPCTGAYNYNNHVTWCNAFPNTLDTAAEFTSFIIDRANGGYTAREATGAAFIIETMIGTPVAERARPPTTAQYNKFTKLVNQYAAANMISWSIDYNSGNINSLWQGGGSGGNWNDDSFYNGSSSGLAIVFNNPDGSKYVIRRECANPVGKDGIPSLQELSDYSMAGFTVPGSPTVKPGQNAVFNHFVRNDGTTSTGSTPIFAVAEQMPGAAQVAGPTSFGTFAAGEQKNVFTHSVPVPLNAVIGSLICERVGWDPVNTAGARNGRGTPVCIEVVADFSLVPVVLSDRDTGSDGDQIRFTYQVTSSGTTNSSSIDCKEVGNIFGPGHTPLPQQDADRTADAGYTQPSDTCPQAFTPNVPTDVATELVTISSLAPGSRVCRSLVVNPKSDAGGLRASAEKCVVVAKEPYVHFMGNDVWAGGDFYSVDPACNKSAKITTVGRTLADGSTAGSVTEYNAFALDRITSFGSASKVLVGSGVVGSSARQLTFANNEADATKLGYFGSTPHCIDDYVSQYNAATPIAPATLMVNGRGSGAWHVTGALTLRGTMPPGGKQVYYADGDVTIDQPLVYPSLYNNIGEIPSLLVITKGNIYVSSTVSQIDGQFVASGNGTTSGVFYTCWPRVEPASVTNPCNSSQLTVNGAVNASRVDLFRSFGATGATPTDRKKPAELFNFSPELYLNSVLNATAQITIQTNATLDLPPRF